MKRPKMVLAVIGLVAAWPFVASAQTEVFNCGPHLLTYEVTSSENTPGTGVRCIQYHPDRAELFVWYGEGKWGERAYHHVEIAFRGGADVGITGRAGDITGNDEDFNNNVTGLVFEATQGNWPSPNIISVTGTWKERWELRPDGVNYTPLHRLRNCGANFVKYTVTSIPGVAGTGIRCVLRVAPANRSGLVHEGIPIFTRAWFGSGDWEGKRYSHLGRVTITRFLRDNLAGMG